MYWRKCKILNLSKQQIIFKKRCCHNEIKIINLNASTNENELPLFSSN